MDAIIQWIEGNGLIVGTLIFAAFLVLLPALVKRATREEW